jgi:hypothetical protein
VFLIEMPNMPLHTLLIKSWQWLVFFGNSSLAEPVQIAIWIRCLSKCLMSLLAPGSTVQLPGTMVFTNFS